MSTEGHGSIAELNARKWPYLVFWAQSFDDWIAISEIELPAAMSQSESCRKNARSPVADGPLLLYHRRVLCQIGEVPDANSIDCRQVSLQMLTALNMYMQDQQYQQKTTEEVDGRGQQQLAGLWKG